MGMMKRSIFSVKLTKFAVGVNLPVRMGNNNWIPLLRKVFLFSAFTETQLSLIAKKMKLISLPKGAIVFQENEPGDAMYVVISGTLRLVKNTDDYNGKMGVKTTIAYLNRGDVVGEMSILVGDLHPNTAVVDATAELLSISKKDFDQLLDKTPSLAVHLSRLLSSRLASINRTSHPEAPAEIFSIIPAIPTRDQVVFSINLGLSMAEQTRRKVLVFVVSQAHHLWAKALGVETISLSKEDIDQGCFDDPAKFEDYLMAHPSGLEIIGIDESTFIESGGKIKFSLLSLIRDQYDYCFFILPAKMEETISLLLKESSRVSAVLGPHSHPNDIEEVRKINQSLLPDKVMEKIWLTAGSDYFPEDFTPDTRLPWDFDWGKHFLSSGSPYIPIHAKLAHRMMDRLARSYAQMLVGLAMGSGAAFGYSLIGILRVLEREGIYPDVVAGTSMGALIGAFYAAGKSPDELEAIARTITQFKMIQLADFNVMSLFRSGLIKGNAVLNFLKSHLGDRTFNELMIPFACVATDIQSGKEVVFDKGNVAEAVRASLSLPFFFKPFYKDGRYLVDGGLVNPVPTSVCVAQGANILLSANLTLSAGERKVPRIMGWRKRIPPILRGPSFPEILLKTIYTMQYEVAATRSGLADVVMHINAPDLLWWDLDKASGIIKLGEAAAEENLSKIKSLLPFFSDHCKVRIKRPIKKIY